MRTILDVKTNARQTRIAACYAIALTAVAICALPVAQEPLPKMAVMMPAYQTAIGLIFLQTALLLLLQFRQSRKTSLALLASAFVFSGFMAILQMFFFPGILTGELPADMQTEVPARIWLYSNLGFPILFGLAILPKSRLLPPLTESRQVRTWALCAVAGPLIAGVLLALSATMDLSWQPVAAGGHSNYSWLIGPPLAWTCFALNVAAFLTLIVRTRLKQRFELWLAITMLGLIIHLGLSFIAGERYTVAWYTARLIHIITAASVLGVLMFEIHLLYSTMSRLSLGLREQASRDSLTRVFTRRYFDRKFSEILRREQHEDLPLTLMIFDIDHFKAYNDRFGHLDGDHCLMMVAREVESLVSREGQFVARYGGEEFVIVLPGLGLERARVLAENIRRSVELLGLIEAANLQREVTISLGLAYVPPGAEAVTVDNVLRAADEALYAAKGAGRNRIREKILSGLPPLPPVSRRPITVS